MKVSLIASLILVSPAMNSQVTEDWVSLDFSYSHDGKMVVADPEDNAYTLSDIFYGDIYLTKRSPDGTILWTATYDNTTASQWEEASSVVIDINGDAIVAGFTNTGFGSEWYPVQLVLMKFSGVDGSLIWRQTYSDAVAYRGRHLLTDSEGNIYVGGDVDAWRIYHSDVGNAMIQKYDPDGNVIWTLNEDDAGERIAGIPSAMKLTSTGDLILSTNENALLRVDTDGNIIWYHSDITAGIMDFDIDPAGNIFTASQASYGVIPFITTDMVVEKYTGDGTFLWSDHYDFGNEEFSRQILCDNVGGAFITGYGDIYFDWITFHIDGAGVQGWTQIYDEHLNNDEIPRMMVKDADDNIYITGQGGPWPGYFWTSLTQMVTVKYSLSGDLIWTALHTDYTNTGSAICLASDNSIYAVGQQYAVTIRYLQDAPPVCVTPDGLFTNNIASTSTRLNWALVPGAFQYEVWYKKVTAAAWKKKFVAGSKNKLNIKNLQPDKEYVWKIRTICDTAGTDLLSDFSMDQFFTTLPLRTSSEEISFTVYPNPADQVITISLPDEIREDATLSIYNSVGQIIYSVSPENNDNAITINISSWPAGLYLVILNDNTGMMVQKIQVE